MHSPILLLTSALWLSAASAQNANSSTSEIVRLLRNANLIPGTIPAFNATVDPFTVRFRSAIVNYGNLISLADSAYAPNVSFSAEAAFPSARYTVAMVDPDAPTPQNASSSQIRHWLVSNVAPSSQLTNISLTANVLSGWRSPSPPAGSDPHRYTFLLLRQPQGANVSLTSQQAASISMFNISTFIQQNNLTVVSGNYFNASRNGTTNGATGSATTAGIATRTGAASGTNTVSATGAVVGAGSGAGAGASSTRTTSTASPSTSVVRNSGALRQIASIPETLAVLSGLLVLVTVV
ncbi:hypothetical protein PYCC9005_000905 [Savitreella phatthalungensis]